MKSLDKAKVLDFILREMIEDQIQTKSNSYDSKFIVSLFKRLAKENNDNVENVYMDSEASNMFELLYHETFDGNSILQQYADSNLFNLTGNPYYNTHDFLNAGGFTSLYKTENETQARKEEKEDNDFINSENQVRLSTNQRITFWLTFAFSVIALGLSIYNIFCGTT